MKKILLGVVLLGLLFGTIDAHGAHRLGVGANYWTALDSIKVDDVDDDGFSYLITYQYRPGLLGLQLDFEFLPDRFGKDAYAPAAYVVLGRSIYIAAGAGIVHQDGDWADDPFYAFKAGLDLQLLPRISFDLGASYRFDSKMDLGDAVDAIDTDTLFLGLAVRFAF